MSIFKYIPGTIAEWLDVNAIQRMDLAGGSDLAAHATALAIDEYKSPDQLRRYPRLKSLSLKYIDWWYPLVLPPLTHLTVSDSILFADDLAALPPTLLSLHLQQPITTEVMYSVRADSMVTETSLPAILPPNLTSLHVGHVESVFTDLDKFPLEDLEIASYTSGILPSSITSLLTHSTLLMDKDAVRNLISFTSYNITIQAGVLELLPDSITVLNVPNIQLDTRDVRVLYRFTRLRRLVTTSVLDLSRLPASLLDLTLLSDASLDQYPGAILSHRGHWLPTLITLSFPPNLTSLVISVGSGEWSLHPSSLPPGLVSLSSTVAIEIDRVADWPRTISDLILNHAGDQYVNLIPDTVTRLYLLSDEPETWLDHFPPHLKELVLESVEVVNLNASSLPRGLELFNANAAVSNSSQLPPQLKTLAVSQLDRMILPASLTHLEVDQYVPLESLPSGIEMLEAARISSSGTIPRRLRHLVITREQDPMTVLPQSLTWIDLVHSVDNSHLPPLLLVDNSNDTVETQLVIRRAQRYRLHAQK